MKSMNMLQITTKKNLSKLYADYNVSQAVLRNCFQQGGRTAGRYLHYMARVRKRTGFCVCRSIVSEWWGYSPILWILARTTVNFI